MKHFPNGFTSWMETHHEIVKVINQIENSYSYDNTNIVVKTHEEKGLGGIYELAEELTDKFEKENKGVVWGEEIEFFDTLETFIENELYS
jgi:hypothetical protein